jgi:hypothetical protein
MGRRIVHLALAAVAATGLALGTLASMAQAAGAEEQKKPVTDDGIYVFQVTDPSGK